MPYPLTHSQTPLSWIKHNIISSIHNLFVPRCLISIWGRRRKFLCKNIHFGCSILKWCWTKEWKVLLFLYLVETWNKSSVLDLVYILHNGVGRWWFWDLIVEVFTSVFYSLRWILLDIILNICFKFNAVLEENLVELAEIREIRLLLLQSLLFTINSNE